MKTNKPLKQLVPEILKHIRNEYENNIIYNAKLMDIYDGQLLKYVEESMAQELTPEAFKRAKERISPINVLRKITEKQSRTYTRPATRTTKSDNQVDKDILGRYETEMKLDQKLQYADEVYSLTKYTVLEPYCHDNKLGLRVLSPKEVIPFSDSTVDPHTPTVMIKLMGKRKSRQIHPNKTNQVVDTKGNKTDSNSNIVKDVEVYHLYSATEFLSIDSNGNTLQYIQHNLGRIPMVYVKNSHNSLIPVPDSDNFAMAILIPKLLSDVNYAIQFLSHSILYGVDIDPSELDGNPDSFWIINSIDKEGAKPQIGTIDPKVDSEKVLSLVAQQIAMWLDTKGLKTSGINMDVSESGIAKIIDEADATSLRDKKLLTWADAEAELWQLIGLLHKEWTSSNKLIERNLSSKFEVLTEFQEQKPIVDKDAVADRVIKLYKEGLMTLKGAVKEMNPDLTEQELNDKVQELEEFLAKKKEENTPPQLKNPEDNQDGEDDGQGEN